MQARVSGASMRQIAVGLGVSVSAIHEDISAELVALAEVNSFCYRGIPRSAAGSHGSTPARFQVIRSRSK